MALARNTSFSSPSPMPVMLISKNGLLPLGFAIRSSYHKSYTFILTFFFYKQRRALPSDG